MSTEPNNPGDGPKENDIIKKLIKDGINKTPSAIISLYGYVGTSDSSGILRLYKDTSFNKYFEINRTDIKDWKENDKDPFGGTYIFVDSNAEVNVVSIQVTRVRARFLIGAISESNVQPQARILKSVQPTPDEYIQNIEPEDDSLQREFTCDWMGTCAASCRCESQQREFTCDWMGTCLGTCRNTCDDNTCRYTCDDPSCYNTCGDTCDHTCYHTCYGNPSCYATCIACAFEGGSQRQLKKYPSKSADMRNSRRNRSRRP